MRYQLTSTKVTKATITTKVTSAGLAITRLSKPCWQDGWRCTYLGNIPAVSPKVNGTMTLWPIKCIPGCISKRTKGYTLAHTFTLSVHSPSLYCSQHLKPPQCLPAKECINKTVYLHGRIRAATERNEVLMYATPWINFGNVMTCPRPCTLKNPHVTGWFHWCDFSKAGKPVEKN